MAGFSVDCHCGPRQAKLLGQGVFTAPNISPPTSCGVYRPINPTVIIVMGKSCLLQISDSL